MHTISHFSTNKLVATQRSHPEMPRPRRSAWEDAAKGAVSQKCHLTEKLLEVLGFVIQKETQLKGLVKDYSAPLDSITASKVLKRVHRDLG